MTADDWPFALADGDSLALLVAESASDPCRVAAPMELAKDIWFLNGHSVSFPQDWHGFLGSHIVDRIRGSSFCLAMLERHSDDVNGLAHRLDRLYFCVQIHGFPGLGEFWTIPLGFSQGGLEPRGLWSGRYLPLPDTEGFATTAETLKAAVAMLPNALLVFDTDGGWQRLRRGGHALSRAMREPWPDFRLHYYMQALEAVIKPGKGSATGSDFRRRAALFTARSPEATSAIEDMYELRCNAEHLHEWTAPRPPTKRRRSPWKIDVRNAQLRLWQAENLAFHVYRRILGRQTLLGHFHDDDAIERFWELAESAQREEWGDPLELGRFEWRSFSGQLGVRDYSPLASFPGGLAAGEVGDVPPWPHDSDGHAWRQAPLYGRRT